MYFDSNFYHIIDDILDIYKMKNESERKLLILKNPNNKWDSLYKLENIVRNSLITYSYQKVNIPKSQVEELFESMN